MRVQNSAFLTLAALLHNAQALLKIIKTLEKQRKAKLAKRKKARKLDKKGDFCFPVRGGKLVSKYGLHYHETLKQLFHNYF